MVLNKLGRLSVREMRNSSVLVALVRETGLVRDVYRRPLYGREKIYEHQRFHYGLFQLPEQVGCILSELASFPTRLRTFVEIGSWYGWTGLFFTAYARRLFELTEDAHFSFAPLDGTKARGFGRRKAARQNPGSSRRSSSPPLDYRSASFDIEDMRTACVKQLAARYSHDLHRIPKMALSKRRAGALHSTLSDDNAAASSWYRQRLAEFLQSSTSATEEADLPARHPGVDASSHNPAGPELDVCFIDGGHKFHQVSADVRFFQPLCRFLLFHDITDADSRGVYAVWHRLRTRLLWERINHERANQGESNGTAWAVERAYFVKECTQQVGTNRSNFGLGLISAQRLNSSWLDGTPPKVVVRTVERAYPRELRGCWRRGDPRFDLS